MDERTLTPEGSVGSKPEYEPPRIVWEEEFEPTSYAKCGRLPGQGGGCMTMPGS